MRFPPGLRDLLAELRKLFRHALPMRPADDVVQRDDGIELQRRRELRAKLRAKLAQLRRAQSSSRTPLSRHARTICPTRSCALRNGTPLFTRYIAAASAFMPSLDAAARIRSR